MFKFESGVPYLMPAHFGTFHTEKSSPRYLESTSMTIGYLTDREKLEQYLPEPFEIPGDPIVSVTYTQNKQVEWMAGGGYNILGVNIPCRFNGKEEQVDGAFALVLWENDTDPIIIGRETLGAPKIYAEIEDHQIIKGEWRTSASKRSHTFFEMTIRDLESVEEAELDQMGEMARQGNWMAWLYIPQMVGMDAPISHATCIPSSGDRPSRAANGKGEIVWHATTWEQNPMQHHIINALADLPILEYRWARVTRGGSTMSDPDKKPLRVLR
ncbi:MAG: acetoacetate decarboxylase family protein [Pseudomonadales bacterium]|nr:acetoacetate decarboxylase family protein [Pseudomonadales bacterium]